MKKFDSVFLNHLSVRARHVCEDNNIYNAKVLSDLIKSGKDLKKLRNCGNKTVHEFNEFIETNRDNPKLTLNDHYIDPTDFSYVSEILNCDNKRKLITLFFITIFEKQNVRTRNAIYTICNTKSTHDCVVIFIRETILGNLNFYTVPNTGKKTVYDLEKLKYAIIEKCIDIRSILINDQTVFIYKLENFLGFKISTQEFLHKILSANTVNIIWFFEVYLMNSRILNEIENEILHKYLCSDSTKTNHSIGQKYSKTAERIRQISQELLIKLPRILAPIKEILNFSYNLREISNIKNYYKITLQPNVYGLQILKNDLSTMSKIVDLFKTDDSFLISSTDKFSMQTKIYDQKFYKEYKTIKIHYLIKKSFVTKSKILEYLCDYFRHKINKVDKSFFYKPPFHGDNNDLNSFMIQLISENFMTANTKEGFLVRRNTLKTIPDFITEILHKNGSPMTANEIFSHLEIKSPGLTKSLEALRGTLTRGDFDYYSGSSKEKETKLSRYGLKKWRKTKGLKPGTIKQLAYEYLLKAPRLISIYELVNHINKFRKTNKKNLISNLKNDPKKKFKFFDGGFVGLTSQNYDEKIISKLKYVAPVQSHELVLFMKNNMFYDYQSLINKFSHEFDLYKIQIEELIHSKCEDGILNIKGDRIYYNSIIEDSIINNILIGETSEVKGFNPYRCKIDNYNFLSRVVLTKKANITFSKSFFEFNSYELDHSQYILLILYNENLNKYKFIMYNKLISNKLFGLENSFKTQDLYNLETINDTTHVISFREENLGKAIDDFKVLLFSNYKRENFLIDGNEINFGLFKISYRSKLEAYSDIIKTVKEHYGLRIQLIQAKEIYNRLKAKER